jgi:uncharacterized membrane protein YidH (DUF202 family)
MLKKLITKIKNGIKKMGDTATAISGSLALAYVIRPVPIFADTSTTYMTPINNLKTVFISLVAAGGVVVLLYGIVTFAISFQKMDQNGEHSAVYKIIAGGIMVGISTFLVALGVS